MAVQGKCRRNDFQSVAISSEICYEFVYREGAKRGIADGLSRQIPDEQLPDWQNVELEQLVKPKPETCTVGEATERMQWILVSSLSFDRVRAEEAHLSQIIGSLEAKNCDAVIGVFRKWMKAEEQKINYHSANAM